MDKVDEECGYTYDHDENVTYNEADGVQWECRRCGAEGWVPTEETTVGEEGEGA